MIGFFLYTHPGSSIRMVSHPKGNTAAESRSLPDTYLSIQRVLQI
jgi:hypothetical protein